MIKSIILLSGGLDSLVSLGLCREKYNVDLALTFDYGQKAAEYEIAASQKICEYYKVKHRVIKLDWLKEITQTALVSEKAVPTENLGTTDSMKSVWVPNRNGLFLNIAASFADSYNYSYIIIGANKEEGETFPDNTLEFVNRVEKEFEYSTQIQPKILAPLIEYDKNEIVKMALHNNIPLELTRSCYLNTEKNCGKCESCMRLKSALKYNQDEKNVKLLF